MNTGARILILSAIFIIAMFFVGNASATSLGIDWKQSPVLQDTLFSGVTMTPDASKVFSGGGQLIVRSWDGTFHWGGQSGFVAAMSPDGNWVVTSTGSTVTMLDSNGQQVWSRNMDGAIRAVAVAPNGTYVITADDKGNYNAWTGNGEFIARNKSDTAKRIAIAPSGTFVVVTTEAGIRTFSPSLDPLWSDSRTGSLEEYIVISQDGSTIITAGGPSISSYTAKGVRNWQVDVTDTAVNDVACSQDCSLIVAGSQDNTLRGIDRYGKIHWTYKTDQWPNAVGTSANGAVVAAGVNDGSVIVLDHNGRLLTEKKFSPRIQPQTLAVSRDGTKIAMADQQYLYGLSLHDDNPTETPDDTVFVAAPLNPVQKTAEPTTPPTTAPPEVTMPEEARPVVTTTTKASPVAAWAVLPAVAGALLLAGRYRRR